MITPSALTQEVYIYPGNYVPTSKMDHCYRELCVHAGDTHVETPATIDEDGDCYHVAIAMPGLRREDILIFVHDHTLSVSAAAPEEDSSARITEKEPGALNSEWHIHLPQNADAEYICAEYREGKLQLFISKGVPGARINARQVMVY